jgi:hypothetical protein
MAEAAGLIRPLKVQKVPLFKGRAVSHPAASAVLLQPETNLSATPFMQ